MRNTIRSTKPEVRFDAHELTAWWHEEVTFTDAHERELRKIHNSDDFVATIKRAAERHKGKKIPEQPKPEEGSTKEAFDKLNAGYKANWLPPTLADMEKTLIKFDKMKGKDMVQKLCTLPWDHPIWSIIKRACYKEDKTLYQALVKMNLRSRVKALTFFKNELETTPKDHPCWQALQDRWDQCHKTDFEDMNTKIIPALIKISLKHLTDVYIPPKTIVLAVKAQKMELSFCLALALKRFGVKVSTTPEKPLWNCIKIVLDAVGQPTTKPEEYIIKGLTKELKKMG